MLRQKRFQKRREQIQIANSKEQIAKQDTIILTLLPATCYLLFVKECAETEFWLDLLKETGLINQKEYDSIMPDCKEILYILIASVKTGKQKKKEE